MTSNQDLFHEISKHLAEDDSPSLYLNTLWESQLLKSYPYSMLVKLRSTEQSPKHHPEGNVWNHTMLVVDEAAKVREKSKDKLVFMWAALLHDIGKPGTTKMKKGRITAYNHDELGASLTREFLEAVVKDDEFIKKVVSLVKWHMHILYVVNEMGFGNKKEMVNEGDIEEIALLGWCDRMGRTNANPDAESENIEKFKNKCFELQAKISRI